MRKNRRYSKALTVLILFILLCSLAMVFVQVPTVKASGGVEQIVNGGFEAGDGIDAYNWTESIDPQIWERVSWGWQYNGSWMMYAAYGNGNLYQSFTTPVSTDSVTTFGFYLFTSDISAYTTVSIDYSDDTYSQVECYGNGEDWVYINLIPELSAGKGIIDIQFDWSNSYYMLAVDDVSLVYTPPVWNYACTFYGPYNETTGLMINENVSIMAHFTTPNVPSEEFILNGSYIYTTNYTVLYFHFALGSQTTVTTTFASGYNDGSVQNGTTNSTGFYGSETQNSTSVTTTTTSGSFWNSTTTTTTTTLISREYWVSPSVATADIYVFTDTLTPYTINFLDFPAVLKENPFVEAKVYVNGTLFTVEKRKADVQNSVTMFLVNTRKYSLVIRDGVSYTFGDLLMTDQTSVQLVLKAVDFPKATLLMYRYMRMYAYREFNTPTGTITIYYEDTLNQTDSVYIEINYKNGTNAYNTTKTQQTFTVTWANADNATDYAINATIHHSLYGDVPWRQYLPRGMSEAPWSLAFLGASFPFASAYLLPMLLIIFVAGCFSVINAEVGAMLTVITAIILAYMGWIPISTGALVTAFSLALLMGLSYAKRRLTYQ